MKQSLYPQVPAITGQELIGGSTEYDGDTVNFPIDVLKGYFSPEYIPTLTVTVGSGEEYETWDEMYAAVRVMAGGELTINSSGPQDNAQSLYDFSNWSKIIVTTGVNFTAYAIIEAPVASTFAGSAIGAALILKNFTFTGTVPVTAYFFAWIDCTNGYGSLVSVTASAFFMSGISGAVAQNITSSCEIQTAGDVTLIDVTAPKITCGEGSLQILASTNNSATLVANFITARNGGSITVNGVDCGANGITNVFTVDQGTIYATASVTGTYTNLYSQAPGIPTEFGQIYADGAEKASLSTAPGQGLSFDQQAGALGNLGGIYSGPVSNTVEYFSDFGSSAEGGFASNGTFISYVPTGSETGASYGGGSTGSSATGSGGVRTGLAVFNSSNGPLYFGLGDAFVSALSAVGEVYTAVAGFIDVNSGPSSDGAYFLYQETTSANWQCVTVAGGVSTGTVTVTSAPAKIAAGDKLEISIAAGESKFWINNVLVATHSANVPTGWSQAFGAGMGILKSSGITARLFVADWMRAKQTLAVPRDMTQSS